MTSDEYAICSTCHVFEAEPGKSECLGCWVERQDRDYERASERYEHNFNEALRRHNP
jgi:hypothetical protein